MVLEVIDSYIVLIMSSFITSSLDPNFNHTPTHHTHHITFILTRDNYVMESSPISVAKNFLVS
jgi:hypothetical protein